MQARLLLLVGILCISIYPVIVKNSLVEGLIIALYRMGIACVVLWLLVIVRKAWDHQVWSYWKGIALCGFLFASDIVAWNYAIQWSSATQGSLLTNLAPLWVGIGSYFFLPQKPTKQFWWGAIVALIGMVILLGPQTILSMQLDMAFALGILSGVLYAIYMLVSKRILGQINVLTFMAMSNTFASLYLLIASLLLDFQLTNYTVADWTSFIILGVVSQVIGWMSLSYALQYIEAQKVSLSLLSQAIITAILAWLTIDETITLQMAAGGAVILLGIGITFRKPKPTTIS